MMELENKEEIVWFIGVSAAVGVAVLGSWWLIDRAKRRIWG